MGIFVHLRTFCSLKREYPVSLYENNCQYSLNEAGCQRSINAGRLNTLLHSFTNVHICIHIKTVMLVCVTNYRDNECCVLSKYCLCLPKRSCKKHMEKILGLRSQ